MRTILSLFLVLLVVTGCGPDGGDIARDFVEGLGDALEDEFEDDDEECVEGEDCYEIDFDLVDEGCELRIVNGRVREVCADDSTEEEVDCSHPYLTTREPLPAGSHLEEVITARLGSIEYWECYDSDIAYHPEGVLNGQYVPENMGGIYDGIVDVWLACGVGTEPPQFTGNWIVTNNNQFCYRINHFPGIINCYPFESFPDGPATVEQIHQGEVIGRFVFSDNCTLRQAQ